MSQETTSRRACTLLLPHFPTTQSSPSRSCSRNRIICNRVFTRARSHKIVLSLFQQDSSFQNTSAPLAALPIHAKEPVPHQARSTPPVFTHLLSEPRSNIFSFDITIQKCLYLRFFLKMSDLKAATVPASRTPVLPSPAHEKTESPSILRENVPMQFTITARHRTEGGPR
jgi:hypothetical protein